MKKIRFFISIPFFISLSVNVATAASESETALLPTAIQKELPAAFANLSIEDFLDLTPSNIKKKTGQRLKWKEVIALKTVQKKIKKELKKGMPGQGGKSQVTALLLALFLGFWGAHRFYLGHTATGFLMMLTAGGCGIWYLVDLIMIATGDLQPKHEPYDETLD